MSEKLIKNVLIYDFYEIVIVRNLKFGKAVRLEK